MKILLVDDNRLIRAAAGYYLAGVGYDVVFANTSTDLAKVITEHKPDVIITSLYSGGFARELMPCKMRRGVDFGHEFALILFAEDEDPWMVELWETGLIDGCIVKNSPLEGLKYKIESAINSLQPLT